MSSEERISSSLSSIINNNDNATTGSSSTSMNNDGIRRRRRIQYALIDISGTIICSSDVAIEGAVDAIKQLQTALGPSNVLFITNTTTISRTTLYEQLVSLGFTIPSIHTIMTSAQAVCHYAQQNNLHPYCLVESDLLSDLQCITTTTTTIQDALSNDEELYYDSVLIGLSPSNFRYDKLNYAYRILRNQYRRQMMMKQQSDNNNTNTNDDDNNNNTNNSSSSPSPHRLLCFHRSMYYKDTDNELSLGPGSFITCLEESIKASCGPAANNNNNSSISSSAYVLGKPSYGFYQAAIQQFEQQQLQSTTTNTNTNTNPTISNLSQSVVMIGDDYRNDILGAANATIGYQILVQTGKYQIGDETYCTTLPNFNTVPSIVDAVHSIINFNLI